MLEITVVQSSELARIAGFYESVGYGGGVSAADVTLAAYKDGRLAGYLSSGQRVLAMRRSGSI